MIHWSRRCRCCGRVKRLLRWTIARTLVLGRRSACRCSADVDSAVELLAAAVDDCPGARLAGGVALESAVAAFAAALNQPDWRSTAASSFAWGNRNRDDWSAYKQRGVAIIGIRCSGWRAAQKKKGVRAGRAARRATDQVESLLRRDSRWNAGVGRERKERRC